MPETTLSVNNTLTFLQQIFLGAEAGTVVLWSKVGKTTFPFSVSNLDNAAAKLAELALCGDTYVGRGLQKEGLAAGKRGTEEGVVFVGGLFADIDTREGPHDGTQPEKLPADADEVLRLIERALLPPPTLLVHTGGGCHAHWLYSRPTMICSPEGRAAEKVMSRALQKRLFNTFTAYEYSLDSTADLARVCKAPGTLNHKTAPDSKPVRLIHQGERYDRANLAALLAPDLGMASRSVHGAGKGTLTARLRENAKQAYLASGKIKPDELAPILAGCVWLQSIVERVERGEKLSEPEWYKMMSIVGRTTDGRQWIHEISKRDPRYNFDETETKAAHALDAAGPALCKTIEEELQFKGCAGCSYKASDVISPINLGQLSKSMAEAQRDHVYVYKGRIYHHLPTGEKLTPEEFADSVMAKVGKGPHNKMMLSKTTPKVMHCDYVAGVPQLILHESDGSLAVNTWRGGGVAAVAGDPHPVLEFLERLIPDTRSREHVTMYLAHLLQRPTVKIDHGVIITGGYGTGKGTLNRIVSTVFGDKNARKIEGVELAQEWTARLVDAQVLMIEEAHHGERLEVFEKTKELLTAEFYNAHDKYIRRFRGRTPRGIFLASNDTAPIVLPRGDRRWFVCATPETPETKEEKAANRALFKALHDRLDQDDSLIAAFVHHLMTLPLDGFNAKGAPPMTAAKEAATEGSRTPTAQVLTDLIAAGLYPLHRDVVEVADVINALKASIWATNLDRLSPRKVVNAMREIGACQVNMSGQDHLELVVGGGKKMRPWAIRNTAYWRSAAREELKAEATRQLTDENVANLNQERMRRMMEEAAARKTHA